MLNKLSLTLDANQCGEGGQVLCLSSLVQMFRCSCFVLSEQKTDFFRWIGPTTE